jgi:hypothetical protein
MDSAIKAFQSAVTRLEKAKEELIEAIAEKDRTCRAFQSRTVGFEKAVRHLPVPAMLTVEIDAFEKKWEATKTQVDS